MVNKVEILQKTLDVLLSVEDDFSMNTRQHGNGKALPRWGVYSNISDKNKMTTLKITDYKGWIVLNDDDEFEFKIYRYDRWWDFLRREDKKYHFTCKLSKVDKIRRIKFANSRAVEITFEYNKKECQDLQREIFEYLEDRNHYDLNHIEIQKEKWRKDKAKECSDILDKSIGKKIKRNNGINDLLDDED